MLMTPFQLFSKTAPNKTFLALVLGAVAGIANATLIPIVLSSIGNDLTGQFRSREVSSAATTLLSLEISQYRFAYTFAAVAVLVLFGRAISQIILTRIAIDATSGLRLRIYLRVMGAPIAEVDRIGFSKLIGAISTDVLRVIEGASVVPGMIVSAISLAGILGYLYLINSDVFVLVTVAIAFGVVTFQAPIVMGNMYLRKSRVGYDTLQEGVRGLVLGGKELKLSRAKQHAYMHLILEAAESVVRTNGKRANTILAAATTYGDMLGFLVIGVVTFIFTSYHAIGTSQVLGCIMALLYLATPVAVIIGGLSILANAKVALGNIDKVIALLPQEVVSETAEPLSPWTRIGCVGLVYRHAAAAEGRGFVVGPVTLELRRAEIVFLVGGNGSGKTTLAKMLSLHYLPSEGHIEFGNVAIDQGCIGAARECVSAIYTDYYLFDRLLSIPDQVDESVLQSYLHKMGLAHKVTIDGGRFSTTALSDGQRKRLALIAAFVDNRDVFIFDEWAADQDPTFKKLFYCEILPELRARRKIVIVISHDDRYYEIADRILVMEDGLLVEDIDARVRRINHAQPEGIS
jgi:putative pyoverdin transport system ATP-binding/permease protein